MKGKKNSNEREQVSEYVLEAFSLLDKVNMHVLKEFRSLLKYELPSKQILVLKTVRNRGKATVNELAEELVLSASSISQLISKLEKGGYVKREVNPENRREVYVSLDIEGQSFFNAYKVINDQIIEKYYTRFTLEEVKLFRNLLLKLNGMMEEGAKKLRNEEDIEG